MIEGAAIVAFLCVLALGVLADAADPRADSVSLPRPPEPDESVAGG